MEVKVKVQRVGFRAAVGKSPALAATAAASAAVPGRRHSSARGRVHIWRRRVCPALARRVAHRRRRKRRARVERLVLALHRLRAASSSSPSPSALSSHRRRRARGIRARNEHHVVVVVVFRRGLAEREATHRARHRLWPGRVRSARARRRRARLERRTRLMGGRWRPPRRRPRAN